MVNLEIKGIFPTLILALWFERSVLRGVSAVRLQCKRPLLWLADIFPFEIAKYYSLENFLHDFTITALKVN